MINYVKSKTEEKPKVLISQAIEHIYEYFKSEDCSELLKSIPFLQESLKYFDE